MAEQDFREVVNYMLIAYVAMAPLTGVGIYLVENVSSLIKGVKQNALERKALTKDSKKNN